MQTRVLVVPPEFFELVTPPQDGFLVVSLQEALAIGSGEERTIYTSKDKTRAIVVVDQLPVAKSGF